MRALPTRSLALLVFSLLALAVFTASAQQPILGPVAAEVTATTQAALPGECLVIFVDAAGQEVYLDITREKGAVVGRKFTIERTGGEIRHPVSGEVVGRTRNRIAEVQITWLQEGFAKAKVLGTPAGEIRVRDSARPAEPPVIVHFPLRHSDGTFSKLTEAIDAEIGAALSRVEGGTAKTGPSLALSAEAATSLASLVPEGDVGVAGRVVEDGIEIQVISMARSTIVRTFTLPLTDALRALGAEKLRTAPASAISGSFERIGYREGGEISATLNFIPLDMTSGDVDGDGIDELIFVEEKHVRILRVKLDGATEEVARVSLGFTARGLFVSAGDVDRDGKAEIFVTEKPGNYVRGTGYRFANGKLTRFFQERSVFLRVVETSDGPVLFGQRHGANRPFDRGIIRYRFASGTMQPSAAGLPSHLTLYDFAPIGSSGFLASIDYENKLRLYNSSGNQQWQSSEMYGGSDVTVNSGDGRDGMEIRTGVAPVDIDGDGTSEALVVQNLLEGGGAGSFVRVGVLQQYKSGRLVALALEDATMVERWKTKTYNGIIKGFTIARPLARGREACFFTVEKVSYTRKRATLRVVPLS